MINLLQNTRDPSYLSARHNHEQPENTWLTSWLHQFYVLCYFFDEDVDRNYSKCGRRNLDLNTECYTWQILHEAGSCVSHFDVSVLAGSRGRQRECWRDNFRGPCLRHNCPRWPSAEKTGRGSLLNHPSCSTDDPVGKRTELSTKFTKTRYQHR